MPAEGPCLRVSGGKKKTVLELARKNITLIGKNEPSPANAKKKKLNTPEVDGYYARVGHRRAGKNQ